MITNLDSYLKNLSNVKLDIGCGPNKKDGYIGVDIKEVTGVDYIVDLDKQDLPISDSSVDTIYCSHFLEHVTDPIKVLKDFCRVLKNDGELIIKVPHYTNPYSYHFTHKTYWSSYSFQQEYLDYYVDRRLILKGKKIGIVVVKILNPLLTFLANANQSLYERFFSIFIKAWEIEFLLKKSDKRTDFIYIK